MSADPSASESATQNSPEAGTAHPRKTGTLVPPVYRFLRGYAFDPTLSIDLDTAAINEVVLPVDWEDLEPGPRGEYLEVVDYDPASNCLYAPVDLNHPYVLARNGLSPSESSPQFHQQMVYAVAMTTIRNFEQALGRKALWAPQIDEKRREAGYVQRLRMYPHALRQANAYYSPQKKALLFGYFPASPANPGEHLPGGTVFTCLSHDIIAHETTHALLDGMHRRFVEPTNRDVRAFHEAFADIVALFQHFSFPEVLRHQIGQTRGDLASQNLLGQIAQQFGATTGGYGALRDAIGAVNKDTGVWEPLTPDPRALDKVMTPHERGAILVAAIFDTFMIIYRSRVADLLRIATNGTGVLPAGSIHPDLVHRMADEAAKTARHILHMCIRALDYVAPVDITFGEYLRAIITADVDAVPYDRRGYRIAFIEAFRRRGIYPRDVRSLSVEGLVWRKVNESPRLRAKFETIGSELLQQFLQPEEYKSSDDKKAAGRAWNAKDRRQIYEKTRELRKELNRKLKELFVTEAEDAEQYEVTGLIFTREHPYFKGPGGAERLEALRRDNDGRPKFEVHALRLAERVTPGGTLLRHFVIGIIQTRLSGFRGGCTLIIDANNYDLLYAIKKRVISDTRAAREERYKAYLAGGSSHSTFLPEEAVKEPFALLHSFY